MVVYSIQTHRVADVTFVQVQLTNERSTTQRVTFRVSLDGPLWVPRRHGIVDPAWDDRTWRGYLDPQSHRGVGFASPTPPPEDGPVIEDVSADRRQEPTTTDKRAILSRLETHCPARVNHACR